MTALHKALLGLTLALAAQHSMGQSFHYVEPDVAACPAAPAPSATAPKLLKRGVESSGRIHVACGFDKGSYTLTLNSSDPNATLSPRTFLVNFGRLVGSGRFAVKFATLGVQNVTVTITSNMGSPAVQGQFASSASEFMVVAP